MLTERPIDSKRYHMNVFICYIPLIFLWIVIFVTISSNNKLMRIRHIQKAKRKRKGIVSDMKEFVTEYIEKECVVYTMQGHQFVGIIKQVSNGAILIQTSSGNEVLNLDYIVRLREVPRKKNGKKKSFYM